MIYEKNFTTQKKKHIHFILLKYSWFKMCWFLIYTKVILSLSYTHTHILFHYDLLKDIGYPCATCCCSVAQLCLTLCDPMDCITPGFPALHHLLELAPLSWWCHPTISSSVIPLSSCLQSFPASGSFPMSQLFASGGQIMGASASASVLPMNNQDWLPLGLTGLSSLQSKGLSRVSTTLQFKKHQFFGAQLSL